MGFAHSEFTRRLLREGLAAEGLPVDGAEFVRRLYGDSLRLETVKALLEASSPTQGEPAPAPVA
ncbi:MAG: hypothetical protein FD129_1598, partial [bacterium]